MLILHSNQLLLTAWGNCLASSLPQDVGLALALRELHQQKSLNKLSIVLDWCLPQAVKDIFLRVAKRQLWAKGQNIHKPVSLFIQRAVNGRARLLLMSQMGS